VDLSDVERNVEEEAQKLLESLKPGSILKGKTFVMRAKTAVLVFYLRMQAIMASSVLCARVGLTIRIVQFWLKL